MAPLSRYYKLAAHLSRLLLSNLAKTALFSSSKLWLHTFGETLILKITPTQKVYPKVCSISVVNTIYGMVYKYGCFPDMFLKRFSSLYQSFIKNPRRKSSDAAELPRRKKKWFSSHTNNSQPLDGKPP